MSITRLVGSSAWNKLDIIKAHAGLHLRQILADYTLRGSAPSVSAICTSS